MYEKSRARKHSDVTLCHTVLPECRSLRCCHSIIHKTSERTEYISTVSPYICDECECSCAITFWDIFTLYTSYIHTEMRVCVCVCAALCCSRWIVCVCVCLSLELWLNACWCSEPKKPKWWMSLMQGQPERKQNWCVALSQHPARATSLHHSSLELNSVAKTNKKKSNYYCRNLYWPSPTILLKGNTLIEMFISEMRGRK